MIIVLIQICWHQIFHLEYLQKLTWLQIPREILNRIKNRNSGFLRGEPAAIRRWFSLGWGICGLRLLLLINPWDTTRCPLRRDVWTQYAYFLRSVVLHLSTGQLVTSWTKICSSPLVVFLVFFLWFSFLLFFHTALSWCGSCLETSGK